MQQTADSSDKHCDKFMYYSCLQPGRGGLRLPCEEEPGPRAHTCSAGTRARKALSTARVGIAARRVSWIWAHRAETLASIAARRVWKVHAVLLVHSNVILERNVIDFHVIVSPLAEELNLRCRLLCHIYSTTGEILCENLRADLINCLGFLERLADWW